MPERDEKFKETQEELEKELIMNNNNNSSHMLLKEISIKHQYGSDHKAEMNASHFVELNFEFFQYRILFLLYFSSV